MSIVLNEKEFAENALKERSLGKKPYETLCRVAKYYYLNHSKKEVRNMLDVFIVQCDPSASLTVWSDTLDYISKNINKYPLIEIPYIEVSHSELKTIDALDGVQTKRLAFTLLCISKYWDTVSPSNNHWVNTDDAEIMKLANINTSIKRQSLMYSKLNEQKLIRFSRKVDNTNVQVLFSDGGEPAIKISMFINLGYQYLKYHGGNFFECENCGITTKQSERGRKKNVCPQCAVEIRMKRSVNYITDRRNSVKNEYVNHNCAS